MGVRSTEASLESPLTLGVSSALSDVRGTALPCERGWYHEAMLSSLSTGMSIAFFRFV